MKQYALYSLLLCLAVTLLACAPITAPNATIPSATTPVAAATTTPASDTPPVATPAENLAPVDTIEIRMLESDPVQVEVVAQGNLADGCTMLVVSRVTLEGNTFQVVLPTQRPANAICTQALVPFERVIPLDVVDATPGEYTIDVNGVTATFELSN